MDETSRDIKSILVVEDKFYDVAIDGFSKLGFTYEPNPKIMISAKDQEAEKTLYVAKTLEEALPYINLEKALKAETPDILISDVNFPRKKRNQPERLGYWLLNEAIKNGIPGVLLTDKEGEMKAHGRGEFSYLRIPHFIPSEKEAQEITGVGLYELAPAKSDPSAWTSAYRTLIQKYELCNLIDYILEIKETQRRNPIWPNW